MNMSYRYEKLTEKELKVKRLVENNLYFLNQYIMYHSGDIEDDMGSFSTSLITVNSDKHYKRADKSMLNMVAKRIDGELLLQKYSRYFDVLDAYDQGEKLKSFIDMKYFRNEKTTDISKLLGVEIGSTLQLINKSILLLAYLDDQINYDLDDYADFVGRNHSENYLIQEIVRVLIAEHNQQTENILNEMAVLFGDLLSPNINFDIFKENLSSEEKTDNRRNYLKAIYIFAYCHPSIDFTEAKLNEVAKRIPLSKKIVKSVCGFNK